jgi:hypothetical protein
MEEKKLMAKTKAMPKGEKHVLAAKPNYWSVQKEAFISSFKNIPKKTFLQSALFDLLTLISSFMVIVCSVALIEFMSTPLKPVIDQVALLSQAGDTASVESLMVEYAPQILRLFWLSFLVVVIASLLALFFISVFYNKSWSLAKGKQVNGRSVRRNFLINFLWGAFWIFTLTLTSMIFKPGLAVGVIIFFEMVLFYYLDFMLRAAFDEQRSVWQNIAAFAKMGVKFYWFIFFILFSFIFITLLTLVMSIFLNYQLVLAFLFLIFSLLVVGWARNYVLSIVNKIS